MSNWNLLNLTEYETIWDFIYKELDFNPYLSNSTCSIKLPHPSLSFDISEYYNNGFREDLYNDLHKCIVLWFKNISKEKEMYALDFQHDCYSFNSNLLFEKDEFDEWLIPVFPNGDLTFNFKNGIFADGINLKIHIWGDDFLREYILNKPIMLL